MFDFVYIHILYTCPPFNQVWSLKLFYPLFRNQTSICLSTVYDVVFVWPHMVHQCHCPSPLLPHFTKARRSLHLSDILGVYLTFWERNISVPMLRRDICTLYWQKPVRSCFQLYLWHYDALQDIEKSICSMCWIWNGKPFKCVYKAYLLLSCCQL